MELGQVLGISRTGLKGFQTDMDIISNNIANVDTVGYKSKDAAFTDLLENQTSSTEVPVATTARNTGLTMGVTVGQQATNFIQGALTATGQSTDLAIEGNGFFGVRDGQGKLVLTRDGDFHRDAQGSLVDNRGRQVAVQTSVAEKDWPKGELSISPTGIITAGIGQASQQLGQVTLYQPEKLQDLIPVGNNDYQVTNATTLQSNNGLGSIRQGYLEKSNVDLAQAMSDMIVAQRAYSLNAKVIQTTDDMMSSVNHFAE